MAVVTLYGNINAKGKKVSGSTGFTSQQDDTGKYMIDFDPAFENVPTVVAALGDNGGPDSGNSDNTINIKANANNCTIWVFDTSSSSGQDGPFNFIAIGN